MKGEMNLQIYEAKAGRDIWLGRQGEHGARAVTFDYSEWVETYGGGVVQAVAKRANDYYVYPVPVTAENGIATWTIGAADTDQPGTGSFELRYYVGDALVKSEIWRTLTSEALGTPVSSPQSAEAAWGEQIISAGASALGCAEAAAESAAAAAVSAENAANALSAENLRVSAVTLPAGSSATVSASKSGSTTTLSFGIPQGAAGSAGADGFSPVAFVTESENGVVFSVTDKNGTTTATLSGGGGGSAENLLAFLPKKQVSGSVVTISDAAEDVPVVDISAKINVWQLRGTPSPAYPVSIMSWNSASFHRNGKNFIDLCAPDVSHVPNINFSLENQALKMVGTPASADAFPYNVGSSYSNYNVLSYGPFPAGQYTFKEFGFPSGKAGNTTLAVRIQHPNNSSIVDCYFYNAGNWSRHHVTFSATQPFKLGLQIICGVGQSFDDAVSFQLERSGSPTDFEAGDVDTYTVNFLDGSNAPMTVYGGHINLTTGLLTSEFASVIIDGTATPQDISVRVNTVRFKVPLPDAAAEAVTIENLFCNRLPRKVNVYETDVQGAYLLADGSAAVLSVPVSAGGTPEEIKSWLNSYPCQLVYKMASPITATFAPQSAALKEGDNLVWADTGDVTVTYRTDIASYITSKIEELT